MHCSLLSLLLGRPCPRDRPGSNRAEDCRSRGSTRVRVHDQGTDERLQTSTEHLRRGRPTSLRSLRSGLLGTSAGTCQVRRCKHLHQGLSAWWIENALLRDSLAQSPAFLTLFSFYVVSLPSTLSFTINIRRKLMQTY